MTRELSSLLVAAVLAGSPSTTSSEPTPTPQAKAVAPKELVLNQSYKGMYELTGKNNAGADMFESVQSVSSDTKTPDQLETIAIKWSVDKDGTLVGRAKFISTATHDILYANLKGVSPLPKPGAQAREALVDVSFQDGTGIFKGATGTAKVKAELSTEGVSEGKIQGTVKLKP